MCIALKELDLMRDFDDFGEISLRTLAVARQKLTSEEYQAFEYGK